MSVARPVSWSAPATISLAEALPRSMRTATADGRISRHAVPGADRVGVVSLGILLPEDGAVAMKCWRPSGPRSRSRPGCRGDPG